MKRLILVAPLLALLIGGSAFADVRGGTASQRRVLVEALTALRAHGVSVEISNLPATHGRQRQLIFSGVSHPESQWKAEVAAGVFAAHGFRLTWITDGSGTIRYNRVAGPFAAATKTQVVEAITQAAHADGVRLDRIELLHPLAFAPVITITVPNRTRFERRGGLHVQSLLDYSKPSVEGIFLIVRNPHGGVWSRGGTAIRLGTGAGTWPGSTHGAVGLIESVPVKSDPAISAAVRADTAILGLFPKHVGTSACRIPRGGPTIVMIHGTCSTRKMIGPANSGFVTVFFKETWNARDFHGGNSLAKGRLSHTWRVSESAGSRVFKVHSPGDGPPQLAG